MDVVLWLGTVDAACMERGCLHMKLWPAPSHAVVTLTECMDASNQRSLKRALQMHLEHRLGEVASSASMVGPLHTVARYAGLLRHDMRFSCGSGGLDAVAEAMLQCTTNALLTGSLRCDTGEPTL